MKRIALCLMILLLIPSVAFADSGATDPSASDFVISADSGINASNGSPSIAWDGTNFFTVWINGTDIYGARVSPDGDVLDPTGIAISVGLNGSTTEPRPPSVAFDGTNYLVVWVCTREGATEIYGCRVSSDGTVLDPAGIKITQSSSPKVKPVGITFNDSDNEYFIVWRTSSDVVRGLRVGTNGVAIGDPAGFQVMSWGFYPTVVYDKADDIYLVATYHNSVPAGYSIHCARVSTDGTVLDTTPITLSDSGSTEAYPRVAFDGTNFMVIWCDSRSDASGQNGSLYGARISPTGTKLGEPFLIAYRVLQNTFPNLVFDGTNYLAVWSSTSKDYWVAEKFRLPDAYAARISTAGIVLDQQAVPLCTAFAHQAGTSVAYGGGRYLALWNDLRTRFISGNEIYDIRGRLFNKGFDSLQTSCTPQALPADITWTAQYVGINQGAASGVATDSGTAWLFGTDNSMKLQSGSWSLNSDAGGQYVCSATGSSDIWAGGWAGFIRNYTDGNWTGMNPESGSPLVTGIWGNSHDDVWASLSSVKAFTHFDGNEWQNVTSACNGDMQDIMGAGPDDIWAVGARGTVQHWNGLQWSAQAGIPTLQTLNAVWVNSPNDAFAVGDHGAILHWDGTSWTAQTSPTAADLKDIWGVDGSHMYAVGHCGTVLCYDGTSWNRENAGTVNDLTTVFGGFGADGTCKLWTAGYGTYVYSKTISVSAPVTAIPSGFCVTSSSTNTVSLAWTLPDDRTVTGYELEYRETGEPDWTAHTLGRINAYTVTGLDSAKSYVFRLKAQYRYVYVSEATEEISSGASKLTVHFNSQGGTAVSDCFVDYGGTITKPADPSRGGYSFDGWYTGLDYKTLWDFKTPLTDGITLYAKWKADAYTVSASANNAAYGNVSGGGTYNNGATATLTATSNAGHHFMRWTEGGTQVSANSDYSFTVMGDRTLVAVFEKDDSPQPPTVTPVFISCSKTDATVFGRTDGSVTISAAGGNSGAYEYSLNGGAWQSGNVFGGLGAGMYTAAARDAGNTGNMATCSVTVGQPTHIGSVPAKKISAKANAGTAVTVIPPAPPKGYTLQSTTFSSSNPSVATVDANGNVTFKTGGKVTIVTTIVSTTVDKKGKVKTKTTRVKKTITVQQPVASVTLNTNNATIARKGTVKLAASIAPGTASNKKLKWTSSNPKIASVSGTGVVSGKAGGTAVITCTAKDGSGASASCTVKVTPIYPTRVKMSKATLTVKLGKTAALKATVLPKTTDFKTVTWTSSNPAVAMVDAKGKVKAVSSGTAVITATTSTGQEASCTVTVQ